MFERFTERARRVVVLAQEESRMLDHNFIGTEHILLGLIAEGQGVAASALRELGVSPDVAQSHVRKIVGQGKAPPTGHIPFTPRAKKVLELSLREALQLGHNYIGTEHILLGLIREKNGVAAKILKELCGDLDRVRQEVIRLLSDTATEEVVGTGGGRFEGVSLEREAVATAYAEAEPEGLAVPRCPRCRTKLSDVLAYETQKVKERDGEDERDVVVVFCSRCGNALGAF